MNESFKPEAQPEMSPEQEADLQVVEEVRRLMVEDEHILDEVKSTLNKIAAFAENLKAKYPNEYLRCTLYHKITFSSPSPGAKLFWDFEGEDSIAKFAREVLSQSKNEDGTR